MTVDFYCVVFFQLCRSLVYTGCSCCWFSDCVLPVLPVLSLLFAVQKASSWNCLWQYVKDMMKKLFVFWVKFLRPWSVFRFYIKQLTAERLADNEHHLIASVCLTFSHMC